MNQAQRHLELLLSQASASVPAFPPNSRYHATEITETVDAAGNPVRHLRRRFVPEPDTLAQIGEHVVAEGDRLDLIAATRLSDPELFWRICDANTAIAPDELTAELGRRLRITMPEGVPGAPDA